MSTSYGLGIFTQHAEMLAASAILPEVARERGYVSVDTRTRLESPGFKPYQRHVPGLLIPVHDTSGAVATWQYRADNPRVTKAGKRIKYETPDGSRIVLDVPPRVRAQLADPALPLWVTEGSRKADAAVSAGLCCIALLGVWNWRGRNAADATTALGDWESVALKGRRVYLAFDGDAMVKPDVHKALGRLGAFLASRGADVRFAYLPDGGDAAKVGLDDFLASGGQVDDLITTSTPDLRTPPVPVVPPTSAPAARDGDSNKPGKVPAKPVPDVPPMTIAQVEKVYASWLHDGDRVTTRVVHAAYVANMVLPGDPVWIILVGGSGQGKTERIAPLAVMPHVEMASTLSGEAALLSATARKDRAEHAHGGLLRKIGDKGILVLKDFTSILEMDRTARGQVLAALREVFDGRWDREVGAEGGQTLTWHGKCGLLAGCTTSIDRAHAVMNDMGPRSLLVRLPKADPARIAGSAIDHMGRETAMRKALSDATAGLLTHLPGREHEVTPEARAGLIGLASLVSLARSPVHRDFKGEIELVGDAEAPTRIVKQLGGLWRACGMLGLSVADSWEVVSRCALDSIPKLRGAVIRFLAAKAEPVDTTAVGIGVVHPSRTVRRALEDLAAHEVVQRKSAGQGKADHWSLSDAARKWLTAGDTLPEMLKSPVCTDCGEPLSQVLIDAGLTTHGEKP